MVTPDEITAVPLFSDLPEAERRRLSGVSADIHLLAGEYAVSEGDERALFAVLDSHIEVVKIFDGVERVLGSRRPGDIFGEVPITLGMPFPAGYRAVEPSRIMRIEAHDYHATAVTAPDLAVKVGEIARGRIGGLQHIAADPPPPRAIVVGAQWDRSCSELRHFLDRNEITFEWIKPENGAATEVRFPDGTTIANPSLREVADAVGLQTRPSGTDYDAVVIGDGRRGSQPRSTARPRGCARSSSSGSRPAARPGRRHGSRTTSASRRASPATSSAGGHSSRRDGSAPRSWSRARSAASTPTREP